MRKASRALREILDRLGKEGLNSPGSARRYGLRTSDRPVSHRRSRITEGHSNDSPTASLLWRRRPASRTSPFPGRGTAPSENKSTFWVIPHTHWEGAVFKTRTEYLEMGLPNILKPMRERSISFGSRGDPCCSRKCLPLKMIPASRLVVRT